MLHALAGSWRVYSMGFLPEHIQKLLEAKLLDQFIEMVRRYDPACLASTLRSAGEKGRACQVYAFAAANDGDLKERHQLLLRAVECGKEACMEEEALLELQKDFFRADTAKARRSEDILFFVSNMSWIIQAGRLNEFIDCFLVENPVCLWYALDECVYHLDDDLNAESLEARARGMLRCIKAVDGGGTEDNEWSLVESRDSRYAHTGFCLGKAGMFREATEMYIRDAKRRKSSESLENAVLYGEKAGIPMKVVPVLEEFGEFKNAASLAEDAGEVDAAIRLYQRALDEGKPDGTEGEWIKATLGRLRDARESPAVARLKTKAADHEASGASAGRTCPQCASQRLEGHNFCEECGQPLGGICPSCGAEGMEGNRFCVKCGHPV